jgi:uncharacterized membrane protein YgcG
LIKPQHLLLELGKATDLLHEELEQLSRECAASAAPPMTPTRFAAALEQRAVDREPSPSADKPAASAVAAAESDEALETLELPDTAATAKATSAAATSAAATTADAIDASAVRRTLGSVYEEAFVARLGTVTELKYEGRGWGGAELASLCAVLGTGALANLRRLWLGGNAVGDAGCDALVDVLRAVERLHTLELRENGIGDQGAACLAGALEGGPLGRLETLGLNFNQIGDEGVGQLVAALEEPDGAPGLTSVRLDGNPASAKSLEPLLARVKERERSRHVADAHERLGKQKSAKGRKGAPAGSSRAVRGGGGFGGGGPGSGGGGMLPLLEKGESQYPQE